MVQYAYEQMDFGRWDECPVFGIFWSLPYQDYGRNEILHIVQSVALWVWTMNLVCWVFINYTWNDVLGSAVGRSGRRSGCYFVVTFNAINFSYNFKVILMELYICMTYLLWGPAKRF